MISVSNENVTLIKYFCSEISSFNKTLFDFFEDTNVSFYSCYFTDLEMSILS